MDKEKTSQNGHFRRRNIKDHIEHMELLYSGLGEVLKNPGDLHERLASLGQSCLLWYQEAKKCYLSYRPPKKIEFPVICGDGPSLSLECESLGDSDLAFLQQSTDGLSREKLEERIRGLSESDFRTWRYQVGVLRDCLKEIFLKTK